MSADAASSEDNLIQCEDQSVVHHSSSNAGSRLTRILQKEGIVESNLSVESYSPARMCDSLNGCQNQHDGVLVVTYPADLYVWSRTVCEYQVEYDSASNAIPIGSEDQPGPTRALLSVCWCPIRPRDLSFLKRKLIMRSVAISQVATCAHPLLIEIFTAVRLFSRTQRRRHTVTSKEHTRLPFPKGVSDGSCDR